MGNNSWTKLPVTLALAALTAGAAQKAYLGDYYHPKLKGGEITIRRVIVFPSSLQLQKNTMKGAQSMEKENEDVVPMLDRAMIRALENSRLTVSNTSPAEAMRISNPGLMESVATEQRSFDSISPALFRRLKDVRKGRFKLPEDASDSKWNEEQKSDTLVHSRIRRAGDEGQGVRERRGTDRDGCSWRAERQPACDVCRCEFGRCVVSEGIVHHREEQGNGDQAGATA